MIKYMTSLVLLFTVATTTYAQSPKKDTVVLLGKLNMDVSAWQSGTYSGSMQEVKRLVVTH